MCCGMVSSVPGLLTVDIGRPAPAVTATTSPDMAGVPREAELAAVENPGPEEIGGDCPFSGCLQSFLEPRTHARLLGELPRQN